MTERPAPRRPARAGRPASLTARTAAAARAALGVAAATLLAGCTVIPVPASSGTATGASSSSGTSVTTATSTTQAGSSQPGQPSSAAPSPTAAEPSSTAEPLAAASAAATLTEFLDFPDLTPLLVPSPDPEVLEPVLDEALTVQDGSVSAAVRDGLTGELLYDQGADTAVVPASAVKILTAVAALEVLGPEHRYTTAAVGMPAGPEGTAVVLEAGGDVMLGTGANADEANGRAGLGTLALRTAEALQAQGTTGTVSVQLDDSGYEGPSASPDWSSDIVSSGNASAVQPMATYGGRAVPSRDTDRLHDPALYAAEVFRDQLAAHAQTLGLDITLAAETSRVPAETAAAEPTSTESASAEPISPGLTSPAPASPGIELASVQSAPLAEQMAYMLQTSDNQVAEATGRNLALAAGAPGSFAGAAQTIKETLADLEVDTTGMALVDASGLSGKNLVSAAQLTAAMQVATTAPDLEAAVTGLPVAGEQGTLEQRMVGTDAAGNVQAKTGTLSSVASLTGTVQTEDGRTLLFSFVANNQPGVLTNARFAVDRGAVALAGCGCR
ncbi:D-alanyl-D-alanine carboxypeptidase/D-alanyl-D-alanine-endopeptidase [Citricoccus sp. K5]|uniref:D-alanyl-D-alanine carboxypeptidase/D-alanyl-D-alanine endopeptidase n=1 Tax=Citricoccus sp. K5 TaxID=2653135 RepID=UPI0012EF5874|nr:D-alanyl-D-alanine carboxypeptidase/D-alanyl-D-alanine-endopeptidase [Citricoccus sp. K5]VXB96127.1 D-alanyl-D-alanine carboxypeptidase [Citricoccus sp. K5]